MMIFSSAAKKILVAAFWLLVWEFAHRLTANSLILVGPLDAFGRLIELAAAFTFWQSIGYSLSRIIIGFIVSIFAGVMLAIFAALSKTFAELLTPLMNVIKSIPLVSFALLFMMWVSPRLLSVVVSFIFVLPIIYFNTLKGIQNTDRNLIEMAKMFRVGIIKIIRHIFIPYTAPFIVSAAESGLGFAFKAAISAEVISMAARNTIGGAMHMARTFLLTADLFAWTIAIVALSFLVEKIFLILFRRVKQWQ